MALVILDPYFVSVSVISIRVSVSVIYQSLHCTVKLRFLDCVRFFCVYGKLIWISWGQECMFTLPRFSYTFFCPHTFQMLALVSCRTNWKADTVKTKNRKAFIIFTEELNFSWTEIKQGAHKDCYHPWIREQNAWNMEYGIWPKLLFRESSKIFCFRLLIL